MPEARILALSGGGEQVRAWAEAVDAVVVGPGLMGGAEEVVGALLEARPPRPLILDAAALEAASGFGKLQGRAPPAVLTPHAGELAAMTGEARAAIRADPLAAARQAAERWGVIVVLKGAETWIAGPDGAAYVNRAGSVGLATSGSGDVLAGVIGGLAARGLDPLPAACWGVALHARAGERLARKVGPVGCLARELPAEIPRLMARLSAP